MSRDWYRPDMARRLLVVATTSVDGDTLREELGRRAGGEGADIRIVAPSSELSPLQWLANEEDDARASAEARAREVADAAEPEAGRVEAGVGADDPVQAIEDALREFPADELVVVTRRDQDASFLEKDTGDEAYERFGLPVTHLAV